MGEMEDHEAWLDGISADESQVAINTISSKPTPPSKPGLLQRLPAEIIFIIFEQLCPHCIESHVFPHDSGFWGTWKLRARAWRAQLLALCGMSQRIGRLAQCCLYHHFGFLDESFKAQFFFARSLCENPWLASNVKEIYLRNWRPYRLRGCGWQNEFIYPRPKWFSEALKQLSPWKTPKTSTYNRVLYGLPVVILIRLLSLRSLTVHVQPREETCWLDRRLPVPIAELSSRISYVHVLDETEVRNAVSCFFQEMALKQGKITSHTPKAFQGLPRPPDSVYHHIRVLRLGKIRLSAGSLETMVTSMPFLSSFSGDIHLKDQEGRRGIWEILEIRKETIREVELHLYDDTDDFTGQIQLPNLVSLRLTSTCIFGRNAHSTRATFIADQDFLCRMLPSSLTSLEFDLGDLSLRYLSNAIVSLITASPRRFRHFRVNCCQLMTDIEAISSFRSATITFETREFFERYFTERLGRMSDYNFSLNFQHWIIR